MNHRVKGVTWSFFLLKHEVTEDTELHGVFIFLTHESHKFLKEPLSEKSFMESFFIETYEATEDTELHGVFIFLTQKSHKFLKKP